MTNTRFKDQSSASASKPLAYWSIGIYAGESPFNLAPPEGVENPVLSSADISDVPAVFVADPFMIRAGDGWHMFFEIKNDKSRKGEIGLATSRDGFAWEYREVVLDEPYHLSYPYVFEWEGEYYMIPETLHPACVQLYKATAFPTEWACVGPLVDGSLADPSVSYFNGKWWMFACGTPHKHDVLRLFFADELTGPWTEHPRSPLIEGNNRIARPGGRVLVFDNRMIRYAQDCHPSYGTQVRAFEITELTETLYDEKEVELNPAMTASGKGWNGAGMHHVDPHPVAGGGWIACVDGYFGDASGE